jgi:hypothetical protein
MAFSISIEGGISKQTMDADFASEPTKGIFTFKMNRRNLKVMKIPLTV